MGNLLLERRPPSELAARSQVIEFEEKLAFFPRLAEIVEADLERLDADQRPEAWSVARVAGRLAFGFADAQKQLPAVTGELHAVVDAVCQRCLEPLELPLDVELSLLFADSASPAPDAGRYEVWEMDEALLRPLDLVEESLIMAIPFAVRHDREAVCREPGRESGDREKSRPFANLRSQMEGSD